MKQAIKKLTIICIVFLATLCSLNAQSTVVKVDLNMSGRTELECNDPNYLPWIPDNAVSISKTFNSFRLGEL